MNTETKTSARNAGAGRIALSKIFVREELLARTELLKHHVDELRQALHRGCKFPAVLVWQEQFDDGKPTGRLVLLDGRHRLAALQKEKPRLASIRVRIFHGSAPEAIIEAAGENTKATMPLTRSQATDKAWQAVRADLQQSLSKAQIARKCAVSIRTVGNMRTRLKSYSADEDIHSSWALARHDAEGGYEIMTDSQRNRMINEGAKELAKTFGRLPRKDIEACVEMVEKSLGAYGWSNFMSYVSPLDEDEERPWSGLNGDLDPYAEREIEIDPDADF